MDTLDLIRDPFNDAELLVNSSDCTCIEEPEVLSEVKFEVDDISNDNCPCRTSRLCDCYAKCAIPGMT